LDIEAECLTRAVYSKETVLELEPCSPEVRLNTSQQQWKFSDKETQIISFSSTTFNYLSLFFVVDGRQYPLLLFLPHLMNNEVLHFSYLLYLDNYHLLLHAAGTMYTSSLTAVSLLLPALCYSFIH